jgi:arylsulfatase A-like enzyme
LFEQCFSPVPTTLPAHLSILTGTHPLEHGVTKNWCDVRPCFDPRPGFKSLAQALSEAGYRTGGFVSATPLKQWSGLSTGFERFDEPDAEQRRAAETNEKALAWLANQKGEGPFFLWVHYYDPHHDYDPPEPYRSRYRTDAQLADWLQSHSVWHEKSNFHPGSEKIFASEAHNLYDGEIRYVDQELKRLLEALQQDQEQWSRTIIALVGDHGEGLGQRAYVHHAALWDDQLHVPMLIRHPELPARRVSEPMSILDVSPILADLMNVPELTALSDQWSGRNSLSTPDSSRALVGVTNDWLGVPNKTNYSWRTARWKLVTDLQGHEIVYDLTSDPMENTKLLPDSVAAVEALRQELGAAMEGMIVRGSRLRGPSSSQPGDDVDAEELRAQLRALGYVE